MDLRPVGVNGILAVLGDSISEQTGAQVAALREAIADAHISSVEETIRWNPPAAGSSSVERR